jgi:hypothetical protein
MGRCLHCGTVSSGMYCGFCYHQPIFGALGGLGMYDSLNSTNQSGFYNQFAHGQFAQNGQFGQSGFQDYYEHVRRTKEAIQEAQTSASHKKPFKYEGDFIEGEFEVISEPKQLENK